MYINMYIIIWKDENNVVSLHPKVIKETTMTSLSFSDFRKNMAGSFDLVDGGERVYINRGRRKIYAIIPIDDDDLTITPALEAKIEKARKEYHGGKTLHFENAAAAQKWMDEL